MIDFQKPSPEQIENAAKFMAAKQANLDQQTQNAVLSAAAEVQKEIADLGKQLTKPIEDGLKKLKEITSELESLVDTNVTWSMVKAGAKGAAAMTGFTAGKAIDVFGEALNAEMTKDFNVQNFLKPEDSPIIQDAAADLLKIVAQGFQSIISPVATFASIVPDVPVVDPLVKIVESINAVVGALAVDIPDDKLNQMINAKTATKGELKAEIDSMKANAKEAINGFSDSFDAMKNGVKDKYSEMKDKASKVAGNIADNTKSIANGLGEGLSQSWKDFKCPELPKGIMETCNDFVNAIWQVCQNIDKVIIVAILKLIGKIFECLNEILGVLGVPALPDPLPKIVKMIPDAITVYLFIMGMPATIMKLLKAIAKKKVKQISIMMDPPPAIKPMKKEQELPPKSCGGCSGNDNEEKKKYKVVFLNPSGGVMTEEEVEEGGSATPPSAYWDEWSGGDYTNVTNSMTLTPVIKSETSEEEKEKTSPDKTSPSFQVEQSTPSYSEEEIAAGRASYGR